MGACPMSLSSRKREILALCTELSFHPQALSVLSDTVDAIAANPAAAERMEAAYAAYAADTEADFSALLASASEAAELTDCHEYTVKLLLLCDLALILRRRYAEAGYDDALFLDSAMDLTYKLEECRAVKGICGTFVADWFDRFYRLTRFALGRLQFEDIRFGKHYKRDGKRLTPESRVINIHIPRDGRPLSPELVSDALEKAYAFYRPLLPKDTPFAFFCSSSLPYDAHKHFLPPTSNLLSFAALFDILESKDDEPGNYHNLWRLFDCDYNGDPDSLPATSSLRRAYIARLKAGLPTGHAEGVFFYRD